MQAHPVLCPSHVCGVQYDVQWTAIHSEICAESYRSHSRNCVGELNENLVVKKIVFNGNEYFEESAQGIIILRNYIHAGMHNKGSRLATRS